ncbi:hypothetical protein SNL152K_9408 [Streptomyces sp. NL15-2K]|nr:MULTISPECIES: hypothetical protein [Actinomycetes]WKX13909.1 hypothetical protein Q4V64_42845 [Kutzneria buriramensis]GCB52052.1 hypothetical protein SNL152K_9408 [Streptomyces sp. NL15-2K]
MSNQLTVQESRHNPCHGKQGTIHEAYREGMEDQLGGRLLAWEAGVPAYGAAAAVRMITPAERLRMGARFPADDVGGPGPAGA